MFLVNSIWSDQHGGSQDRDSIMKDMNFEEMETAMKVCVCYSATLFHNYYFLCDFITPFSRSISQYNLRCNVILISLIVL